MLFLHGFSDQLVLCFKIVFVIPWLPFNPADGCHPLQHDQLGTDGCSPLQQDQFWANALSDTWGFHPHMVFKLTYLS